MTDKKTDDIDKDTDVDLNQFDPNQFDLNHFDQTSEPESFEATDELTKAEQSEQPTAKTEPLDTAWDPDLFTEPGISHKNEPLIDEAAKQPVMITPEPTLTTGHASAQAADQRSGTKSITAFAILAILIAAIAVWLNPGATSDNHADSPPKPRPIIAADVQTQGLEARMTSLEQRSKQQSEELNQQIKQLQQQVSNIAGLLAKQSRKQPTGRRAKVPVAKRSTSIRHPRTVAVASSANVGWVVNLASVDSKRAARKILNRYKAQGIPVKIYAAVVKGKTWYRLRIGGFANKQKAIAQKNYLATKHGIKDAWIQKP